MVCVDVDERAAQATAPRSSRNTARGSAWPERASATAVPRSASPATSPVASPWPGCSATSLLAYGGLDAVVVTAGIFVPPDTVGPHRTSQWARTFGINVTGAYIVADEAHRVFKQQGLPANIVLTTSANAVVAKKGSLAYDTSKAAANHLVRELAVEMAPLVRVNAVAPATVVKGSTMFPRDRVIASLAKYGIAFSEDESTEALRDKLAGFYAKRSLTQSPIEPDDQAEAIFLLVSQRLAKTTGHVIPVDGGLQDGFLR